MRLLNFMSNEPDGAVNSVVTYWTMGLDYKQASEMIEERFGVYMPEDQYLAIGSVLQIQMDLDIGNRQGEHRNG